MSRVWEPHESHLPYLLQLKIDFNLSGMAWLRLAHARFRRAALVVEAASSILGVGQRGGVWPLNATLPSRISAAAVQGAAACGFHAPAPRLGHPPAGRAQ